jgi:hypothetical protein
MSNTTYKFDSSLKVTPKRTTYIGVGIHENISLIGVRNDVSPNGSKFLEFTFENTDGQTLKHTEYEPIKATVKPDVIDPDQVKELEEKYETWFQNKIKSQMARVYAIASIFVPEDMLLFEVKNFEEFSKRIVFLLSNSKNGKKVRIKVVYSDKGYASLPTYTKMPWIEPMDISSDKSAIGILSIDKMTRDAIKDKEAPTTAPALLDSTTPFDTTRKPDDLPF